MALAWIGLLMTVQATCAVVILSHAIVTNVSSVCMGIQMASIILGKERWLSNTSVAQERQQTNAQVSAWILDRQGRIIAECVTESKIKDWNSMRKSYATAHDWDVQSVKSLCATSAGIWGMICITRISFYLLIHLYPSYRQ